MSTMSIDNQAHQGESLRVVFDLPAIRAATVASTTAVEAMPSSYWTFEESSSEAVLMTTDNSELERQQVVITRINAVLESATALGGQVLETYECELPDRRKVTFCKTVQATKTSIYTMNDVQRRATVSYKYSWAAGSLVQESGDVVAYAPGNVTRMPVPASIRADNMNVRLTVTRTFTRPDGTTFTAAETTPELPITLQRTGYAHTDANHASTELRRFTATHEGVQVSGDFPGVLVRHAVVLGGAAEPVLAEDGAFMNARFTVTDTYTRPDNSTYSTTERSYAERWAITEPTETRHHGSNERKTWEGSRNRFTGNSTKVFTTFHQMGTYQRRIATKPDGSVHVIRDWWHVSSYENQGGERHVRD